MCWRLGKKVARLWQPMRSWGRGGLQMHLVSKVPESPAAWCLCVRYESIYELKWRTCKIFGTPSQAEIGISSLTQVNESISHLSCCVRIAGLNFWLLFVPNSQAFIIIISSCFCPTGKIVRRLEETANNALRGADKVTRPNFVLLINRIMSLKRVLQDWMKEDSIQI